MANFSVLASFWIIKISQAKERSTEEKQRKECNSRSRAQSLWETLFCTACEITLREPHIWKRLEIAVRSSTYGGIFPFAQGSQIRISNSHALRISWGCEISWEESPFRKACEILARLAKFLLGLPTLRYFAPFCNFSSFLLM